MKGAVLVINSGSSSLKFALLDHLGENLIMQGIAERLGMEDSQLMIQFDNHNEHLPLTKGSHKAALTALKEWLLRHPTLMQSLVGIGHRVVHGGEQFNQSVVIDNAVLERIQLCSKLAPLHNPAQIKGIKVASKLFPNLPQVAVFDTAFHQTIAQEQYLYPIPMGYYRDHAFRKYGFHGSSYRYISNTLATLAPESQQQGVLVAHLGNGASTCAIQNGQSVDTSMGLTPLDGLMMGTRSGSIDPSLIAFISKEEELSLDETMGILNKHSGLLGISELSNDCRTLEEAMKAGDERSKLALDMFCYSTAKNLMTVATALDSIDHLVFTGGIGENSVYVRKQVCQHLKAFSIQLDNTLNDSVADDVAVISSTGCAIKIWVIPTNEELMIALDTLSLIDQTPDS